MEVYEKINNILKQQNITKREFAKRLIQIEPKLKSTGEIPTEKAIYGYLSGASSIKIELIPYIAETLRITEQELFFTHNDKRINFYKMMVLTASLEEIKMIKEKLELKEKLQDIINPNEDIKNLINPLIQKLENLKSYIKGT